MAEKSQKESSKDKPFEELESKDMLKVILEKQEKSSKDEHLEEKSEEESEEELSEEEDDKEASEDTDEEEEENEDEEEESSSEESDSESTKDKEKDEDKQKLEKSYKSLQAEFTRKSQELAELKKEHEEKASKQNAEKDEQASIIDEIRADNPKAADLFQKILDEADRKATAKFEKRLESITSKFSEKESSDNVSVFSKALDIFLKGPLKALEPKLNEIFSKRFSSNEQLIEAAGKNSGLFKEIERDLKADNFEEAASLIKKKKNSNPELEKKRDKEIESGKGPGKSKTGSKKTSDSMELSNFKELDTKEMEKQLRKKGVFTQ